MDKSKRALFGLSFGHFMLDMYAAILIPLYPIISQRLDINLSTISLVIAIGHAVSSILQPVFGYISDKITKRVFMFFGLFCASLFMPLGFIAKNTFILTLCLILGMLGNALYHPQVTSIIKDFYRKNLALSRAIGIFLGLGTIGYAIGPYLSAFVLEKFKDQNYVFIGVFGIVFAIFMLFFVPKRQYNTPNTKANFKEALFCILKNKICLFLIFITVIKAALVMSFGTYIPFLLKKFDFSTVEIGFILSVFYILGGVSMIISSKLEKIIGVKGVIIASFAPLLPLTLLSIYLLNFNKFLGVLFFLIEGFFVLLQAGVVLSYAQQLIPEHTGTISGIIQGFTLALGSLCLIPLGQLGQHFGIEMILITITTIALLSAIWTKNIEMG